MKILFFLLPTFLIYFNLEAQVTTKAILSDHAILQRGVEIPISGVANANDKLAFTIGDLTKEVIVDKNGKWKVRIPPMEAGGPYKINIKEVASGQEINYIDIYFGDVWLCSGQSNMEWRLKATEKAEEEIKSANDPLIRQFKVAHANSAEPLDDLPDGEWHVAGKESLGDFTAVGYYFAKEIRASEGVPIGLLNSSWGGSRIEPWISKETLDEKHPEYNFESYTQKNNNDPRSILSRIKKMFPDLDEEDQGMQGDKLLWQGKMEEGKWRRIEPDKLWEEQGFQGVDGVAYYRTEFEGSEDLVLELGAIDDSDMVWVNGILVGETEGYNLNRVYSVGKEILREGLNELVIRVEDTGGGGGMYATDYKTAIDGKSLSEFEWQIRFGAIRVNTLSNHIPNLIYNAMIHPVIDYPIKGVIWYQGESNAGSTREAYDYRFLLRTLINEWRSLWQNENLPFYYVSLANWQEAKEVPGNDGWAVIRESMTDVLELPYTGQAIIIDIGNPKDIHPRNKKDVGKRLALPALKQVYGKDVVGGSPKYRSHTKVGSKMHLEFDYIGSGLMLKDKYGYGKGFSIAGADGKFVWAQAILEGNTAIVWSDKIGEPVAVRYAWEINPEDANLFTKDGLPMTPFRTDDFDVIEE